MLVVSTWCGHRDSLPSFLYSLIPSHYIFLLLLSDLVGHYHGHKRLPLKQICQPSTIFLLWYWHPTNTKWSLPYILARNRNEQFLTYYTKLFNTTFGLTGELLYHTSNPSTTFSNHILRSINLQSNYCYTSSTLLSPMVHY